MFRSVMRRAGPAIAVLLLASCGSPVESPESNRAENSSVPQPTPAPAAAEVPVAPSPPGMPGGLEDERTPVSEAPFSDTSTQGAANVVQTYYALVEAGKYEEAWKLWSGSGRASGMGLKDFADAFGKYREYHAEIGAPGDADGAAGSVYVTIPVQAYGRLASGEPFKERGTVTLRRINNVPGSTAEQRKWHIEKVTVGPGRSGG